MDMKKVRAEFPILDREVYGRKLVYLDNAATTQKPRKVIEKLVDFYENDNGNPHRGAHYLGEQSTRELEQAREKVRKFINADDASEIVFTKGATESINLAADCFADWGIRAGDEVVITQLEHHSNIVPWQVCCRRKNAKLKVVPIDDDGNLLLGEFAKLINGKTRIIALTHVSNVLGCVNPLRRVIDAAHERNIPVLVDAAQAVKHIPVDVRDMDCDFLAFSGHKLYAGTGTGVLYAKKQFLEKMPPYQLGSAMIGRVSFENTTFAGPPFKYEAGTINYAGAISLGAGIDYLESVGFGEIREHEKKVYEYARKALKKIEGLKIYGNTENMCGAISFNLDNIHPYDAGMVLDRLGIAVRTGHHCSEPLMERLGVSGTVRASFAMYNTFEEVDELAVGINKVKKMMNK